MKKTASAPKIDFRPIDGLIPYARNARTHSAAQVAQLAASLVEFGWTNPVLADDDGIVAGHGRVMAARLLYDDNKAIRLPSGGEIPLGMVPVLDCTGWSETQRRAYILADNQHALNAGWDLELLNVELKSLKDDGFDIGLAGFDEDSVEQEPTGGLTDPDDVPDVPPEPTSQRGDVWLLGRHRVMCGSATDAADLEILLEGEYADMVFTDPPYLMNFTGAIDGKGNTRSKHDAITNDNLSKEEGDRFLREVAASIKNYCRGAWYVCFYRLGIDWMMNALTDTGLKWRNLIIWKKNQLNLSNSDYKSIYEPIIYGWQTDYEPVLYGWNIDHEFHGSKGQTDVIEAYVPSVWEIERTKNNDLHPTMKPVELCERAILNSSKRGEIVLDLFGGSGSTLIAAERVGRAARLIELEPKYVDVIVQRWQSYTGQKATHETTGEFFD